MAQVPDTTCAGIWCRQAALASNRDRAVQYRRYGRAGSRTRQFAAAPETTMPTGIIFRLGFGCTELLKCRSADARELMITVLSGPISRKLRSSDMMRWVAEPGKSSAAACLEVWMVWSAAFCGRSLSLPARGRFAARLSLSAGHSLRSTFTARGDRGLLASERCAGRRHSEPSTRVGR